MGKDARWPGAFIAGLVFRVVAQLVSGAILIRLRSVVRVHPTRPKFDILPSLLGQVGKCGIGIVAVPWPSKPVTRVRAPHIAPSRDTSANFLKEQAILELQ